MSNQAEKLVLDLETKKSFDEVEGRALRLLGVSVAGIYSYNDNEFKVFLESQIRDLVGYLQRAELIIGFNIKRFDFPVLQPYLDFDLATLNTLDIFEEVQLRLGFRIGLNSLAQATLELEKLGNGLDALRYFREAKFDKLREYCQHDVFITRELYEYGRTHGYLLYFRGLRRETIPVNWGECESVDQLLHEAFSQRRTLEIEYASSFHNLNSKQLRQIDIYNFELGQVIAFCHLRKAMRTFNLRRIISAKLTEKKYRIPATFDLEEFKSKQKFFPKER